MISVSDLELIANILKWNSSHIETDLVIENIKEKEANLSQNDYYIVEPTDEKVFQILNVTDICDVIKEYDIFEATVVTKLFLLIVVTVKGNTLIISAVVTTKSLRTVTNCFVTSLAAADLLVSIFVIPPAIAVHISGWPFLIEKGFVACWLPFFLYYKLTPFISSNYVNSVLMYILTWLGWFISAINPFIYAFYSGWLFGDLLLRNVSEVDVRY